MVNEIHSQCGMMTTTLTKSHRRWRLAYFTIYFSNFILSIVKVPKKLINCPISKIVATPSYTALEITFDDKSEPNIDEDELVDMIKKKDMKILQNFNGVEGLARYLHTTLEYGIMRNDIERRKLHLVPTFAIHHYQKGSFYFGGGFQGHHHYLNVSMWCPFSWLWNQSKRGYKRVVRGW